MLNVRDFTPYEAVLLDLDGTIYQEEHALPGAVELIKRLQREGRRFACLSNSTLSSPQLVKRIARMGADLQASNIYTAADASADYAIKHFGPAPRVMNLATDGLYELLDGRARWVDHAEEVCDIIIVGALTNVHATEDRMRIALRILRRQQPRPVLLGMCADRVFPSPRGLEFGSGAATTLLAYAGDVRPVFTGKPERVFFEELCERLEVDPARCVLVGDNLESDILGAKRMGMRTILTLSGVTHRQDLDALPADRKPDAVIEDLRQMV